MPKRTHSVNIYGGQSTSAEQLPVGVAMPFSGNSAGVPEGFIIADGRTVLRSTYRALSYLYSLSSYPYGAGDGVYTFTIPDMRGRSAAGKDNLGGTSANRITIAGSGISGTVIGSIGGSQSYTLALNQAPPHNHGSTGWNNVSLYHYHGGIIQSGTRWADNDDNQLLNVMWNNIAAVNYWNGDSHQHTVPYFSPTNGVAVSHSNMPPTGLTFWIIKV